MMHWNGFGMGFGGFGWIFMVLSWVILIVLAVYLIKYLFTDKSKVESSSEDTAEEILKKRFAKGEISKSEYEEHLKVLKEKL
jgi:putative membrane protein